MFLAPLFLAGLAALSIPVLIHLRAGQRHREIRWAAMQFLETALATRESWMRLRNRLLLLMRIAVLLLLILALSRPLLPLGPNWPLVDAAELRVVLVVDDTASMQAKDPSGESKFEWARSKARAAIDRNPSAKFAVIFVSKARAGEWLTPAAAKAVLDRATAGASDGDLPRALLAARATLEDASGTDLVIALSDHQRSCWPTPRGTTAEALKHLSEIAGVCLESPPETDTTNAGIVDFTVSPSPATANRQAVFEAVVASYGTGKEFGVRLFVDDCDEKATVVRISPGQTSATATFRHRLDAPGTHRVEVRLEDDALEVDNSRYLALDVVQRSNVLCLAPDEPGADYAPTAFVQALIESAENCPFEFSFAGPEELDSSKWCETTRLLITAAVPGFSSSAADVLRHYLENGGAWLCFCGSGINVDSYNSLAGKKILPARLSAPYGSPRRRANPQEYFQIDCAGLSHPVFDSGESPTFTRAMFAEPKFFMAHDVLIEEPRSDPESEEEKPRTPAQLIARFNNGRGYIAEGRVGNGVVLLFSSACDLSWNDLALTPAFVLVDRAVNHVLESTRTIRQRRVGEPLSYLASGIGRKPKLVLPDGTSRPGVSDEKDPNRFQWDATDQPGFYEVELSKASRPDQPGSDGELFALNIQASESELTPVGWDDIRDRYKGFNFVCEADKTKPIDEADKASRRSKRVDISRLLALLVICMLIGESVFAAKGRSM